MAKGNINTNNVVIRPHEGFQEQFTKTTVDVVFGGGVLAAGKSYALVLAFAEPLLTDPEFRAMISRKQMSSLKVGGGFVEKFKQIFGKDYINVRESQDPRISFPIGTFCDLTYIDDSNIDKLRERAKGWEYDAIGVDELTELSWEAFSYVITRNRGNSKTFTGKFFATLNPKRSHWSRIWLDWYIGSDGFIIPERNGKTRFFYIKGKSVNDVVWGDTKEEVYAKCRIDIDRKLSKFGGDFTYKNIVKSFVFYQGKIAENKELISNNPNYIGSIAMSGGKLAQALAEGNFNVDPDEDEHIPITSEMAQSVFMNDAAVNGDKWVTMDIADVGTDNAVILAWNGFHVIDIDIIMLSTPKENAQRAKAMAARHGVADCNIVYDATAARYFNDYIEDAIPYISGEKAKGMDAFTSLRIKDACYRRLVSMIKRGQLTFSDEVSQRIYTHQNLKLPITVQSEFLEECSVVRFIRMQSGKDSLMTKKQMNANLGKNRSMDLLDPCAMRMYPTLYLEYGEELADGFRKAKPEEEDEIDNWGNKTNVNIYDNTLWA